ncbi:MAG: chemotaxis protein CheX [Candidatus Cloacimonetes bacterium]|jgi:chemotaxis protein CheX|nr:chemotaxis protein CheX [Candidatus Cloacimonadota bacterium]
MHKAALINLEGKFSLYSIIDSQTFEPVFLNWTEDLLNSLKDYSIIFYYSPQIDKQTIKTLRKSISFLNIKLVVFTDSIDLDTRKTLMQAGADLVELLPISDNDFVTILKDFHAKFTNIKTLNHNLLTPFKLAIEEILSMMAVINVEFVDAYQTVSQFHFGDLSGIMALAGEKKGAIMISFYENLARKIIAAIMAVPEDDITEEEEHDGVGELINMIAGGAKARLGDSETHFLLSAPTVITGNQHRVIQQKDMPCIVLVYKVEEDYFAIQICLMNLINNS